MVHVDGGKPAKECCGEHHAFDANVHHPGPLTIHAGQGSQRQRCCHGDGRGQHAGNDQDGGPLLHANQDHHTEQNNDDQGDKTKSSPVHVVS